jgi:hypothetical protein
MASGITHLNSAPRFQGYPRNGFAGLRLGYAYQSGEYFIHFSGEDSGTWKIYSEFTGSERAEGSMEDWVGREFGAQDIKALRQDVGSIVSGVWRPGLFWQDQRLAVLATSSQQRAAEQSLYLLVDRLNDVLLYIEPDQLGLDSYGPKTRELLILACTEVENTWADYLRRAGVGTVGQQLSTNDYVRLRDPLYLAEYRVALTPYPGVNKVRPFQGWSSTLPTQSLQWYDAYNKAKHDRSTNLKLATLRRCIESVAANVALFCVRFSPYPLYDEATPLSASVRHLFDIDLVGCDPTTFYVPFVDFGNGRMYGQICEESRQFTNAWQVQPLVV